MVFALDWLSAKRAVLYGGLVCVLYLLMLLAMTGLNTAPPRVDFIAFHSAGRMALAGNAPAAYDWDAMRPVQAATLGVTEAEVENFLGWVNPPQFLFAVIPFALLPYTWGWFAWSAATALLVGVATWSVMPNARWAGATAVLSIPAVFACASVGQNGILTAALFGWAYALLDRRPWVAGIAFGLLTYKPQFGLLVPVLLLFTGRWRVVVGASATAVVAGLAALFAFGPGAWLGFIDNIGLNNERYLATANSVTRRIQSVYAVVLGLSGSAALSWGIHLALAGLVALAVLRLWLRRPAALAEVRAAAAIAAAFLMTPFTWIYDLPSLGVAALFLANAARREGWLPGEKASLLIICLLTQAVSLTGPHSFYGPVAWLLILASAWRRDRAWRLSSALSAAPA